MNVISTHPGASLVYARSVTPFLTYRLANFFRTVPHAVIESALMDSAPPLLILLPILLPLSLCALVTLVVVNALWVWNNRLIALVLLPQDDSRTLMVGIIVFGQRYFRRGLVAGAVKG